MGFSKNKAPARKKHKNKKVHRDQESTNEDEVEKENTYDIEASDDEANEIPAKWYDEVSDCSYAS